MHRSLDRPEAAAPRRAAPPIRSANTPLASPPPVRARSTATPVRGPVERGVDRDVARDRAIDRRRIPPLANPDRSELPNDRRKLRGRHALAGKPGLEISAAIETEAAPEIVHHLLSLSLGDGDAESF